ncbi:hypothetical protein RHMOL_Rhmol06G0084200 [Rhododendron molle]|uniref:Uncharacterized protein n=1 Tax=Rhododendron molle TaxID=49168 RepID=A0ACC0NC54_RHOML|nr:hypothetical protein RHMOL_Rhmol06G0084200 [Rhododendron molle]
MATEISIEASSTMALLDKSSKTPRTYKLSKYCHGSSNLRRARGLFISALLGTVFSLMVHRLSLTTGVVPSLCAPAAFLAFYLIELWNQLMSKLRLPVAPLTRQENTVIQTCIVACFSLAYSGKIILVFSSAISSF